MDENEEVEGECDYSDIEGENVNDEGESNASVDKSDESDDASNHGEEQNDDNPENDKSSDEKENIGNWEDIYGRTRAKDGSILQPDKNNDGKYIPPALRKIAGKFSLKIRAFP